MSLEIPESAKTIDIQLRFADTDQAGHVNHAVFITFLETARIEWLLEDARDNDFKEVPLIIANVNIDYIRPIHLDYKPQVTMWVSRVGTKSFDFDYVIHDREDTVYAKATTVQVYFDYEAQKSLKIPERERNFLESYMGPSVMAE